MIVWNWVRSVPKMHFVDSNFALFKEWMTILEINVEMLKVIQSLRWKLFDWINQKVKSPIIFLQINFKYYLRWLWSWIKKSIFREKSTGNRDWYDRKSVIWALISSLEEKIVTPKKWAPPIPWNEYVGSLLNIQQHVLQAPLRHYTSHTNGDPLLSFSLNSNATNLYN